MVIRKKRIVAMLVNTLHETAVLFCETTIIPWNVASLYVSCYNTQFKVTPRYWTQTNPPYEVDFLIQRENDIFPVEVKSEANTFSKSLKKFKELFPDKVKLRVRFSLDNLRLDDDVLNIPLFMTDYTDRLIGLALEQRKAQK